MAKDYSRKIQLSAEHMQKVFGAQDAYVKKLEEDYDVTIVDRNGSVTVTGEDEDTAAKAMEDFFTANL